MAYRRKTYRRKRPTYRKKFFKKKRFNKSPKNIHLFKRVDHKTINVTDSDFQQVMITDAQNEFRLDDLVNYDEYQAMYDSYKIAGIKVKFIYDSINASSGVATQSLPLLLSIYDANDATLTNEEQMIQYKTFKVRRLNKPISLYFKPFQVATGTTMVRSRYNPTSAPDVVHRGIKVAVKSPLAGAGTTPQGKLSIYTTFYLCMKTPI